MYLVIQFLVFCVGFTVFSEESQASLFPASSVLNKVDPKNIFNDSIKSGDIVINFKEHNMESIIRSLKEIDKNGTYYSATLLHISPNSLHLIIDYLKNVAEIVMISETLTLDDLNNLRRLPSLYKLKLEKCKVTYEGAEILASIKSLRDLDLSGNFIGYKGARALAQKPNLISLN